MKSFVTVLVLAGFAAAHPWACFHGDPQHTGRSPHDVGIPVGRTAGYYAGGSISGSPVVRDDGCVLFGARDVRLYCLDADLASAVWVADLSAHGTNIYYSTPALDDTGNAYITTSRKLVKVSRGGTVLWAWPDHNSLSISHSPVIGPDGKIFFACYSDSLYALSPRGTLEWAADLGGNVNASPAVGPDGRVYVATTRGSSGWKLWCFNPDGSSPWAFDLAAAAEFASPAVGPDTVSYVGAGRYLYAINPNGTLKWRDSLLAQVQSCPAIANESTLYVVAGARLYSVDTDSGVRWRVSLGGSNYCSPAVDRQGFVYVGSANSSASGFYCIAPDSSVLYSYATGGEIWSSPAIGEGGRVYVGAMDNNLHMFLGPGSALVEGGRGQVARSARLWPNPTRGALSLSGGASVLRVHDSAGRQVATGVCGTRVDLSNLEPGVYVVTLSRLGRVSQEKVVRQ